ncbi:MAG: hypothetical protein NTX49_01115 [Chlamydiae bacterium]|nr:hypothetical protein [Chlamydiota bacterium]
MSELHRTLNGYLGMYCSLPYLRSSQPFGPMVVELDIPFIDPESIRNSQIPNLEIDYCSNTLLIRKNL